MYLGPSYLDRPSSEELSAVEINTWIHKVLDLGADLNPRAGPALLQEGLPVPELVCLDLFQWLTRFFLFITLAALRRVLVAPAVNYGMSIYLRMWRGGRRAMPAVGWCGHGEGEGER
jgi:hypothetical protein